MRVLVPPPRVVSRVLAVAALAFALTTFGGYLYRVAYGRAVSSGLVRLLDVDEETSIPTWFSSMLLLLSAGLLAIIGSAGRADRDPYAVHWYGLAIIFVGLSIDEAAVIHEMFETAIRMTLDVHNPLAILWIIPYSIFALLVLVTYLRFLRHLPARTRSLMLVAGGLYVAGAVGAEVLAAPYEQLQGKLNLRYVIFSTAEELLEMFGIILFIHTLLAYLRDHVGEVRVGIDR